MYKTHKNIPSLQLDILDELIMRVRDNDELKPKLEERVRLYRDELKNNSVYSSKVIVLEYKIRYLTVKVLFYLSGKQLDVLSEPPRLPRFAPIESDELTTEAKIGLRQLSDLFNTALDKTRSLTDLNQRQRAIFSFEQEYMNSPELNVQAIEQQIAEIKYDLMIDLLLKGQLNKAKILSHSFNSDMRLYIVQRLFELSSKIGGTEANELLFFLDADKPDITSSTAPEKNLKFWERVIRLQYPQLNYHLPVVQLKQINTNKSNIGLFGTWIPLKKPKKNKSADQSLGSPEQIPKQEMQIDPSGEEAESLQALLDKIKKLTHEILYLKLGIKALGIPISAKKDLEHDD